MVGEPVSIALSSDPVTFFSEIIRLNPSKQCFLPFVAALKFWNKLLGGAFMLLPGYLAPGFASLGAKSLLAGVWAWSPSSAHL